MQAPLLRKSLCTGANCCASCWKRSTICLQPTATLCASAISKNSRCPRSPGSCESPDPTCRCACIGRTIFCAAIWCACFRIRQTVPARREGQEGYEAAEAQRYRDKRRFMRTRLAQGARTQPSDGCVTLARASPPASAALERTAQEGHHDESSSDATHSALHRRRIRPAVSPAAAQNGALDTRGRVYTLIGGAFGDGPFIATGIGTGIRLTPHLGLDLELAHLAARRAGSPPAAGRRPGSGPTSVALTAGIERPTMPLALAEQTAGAGQAAEPGAAPGW